MVEAVENHGGTINKFMGDGFMAWFGPGVAAAHADAALAAGRDMLARLRSLNERLQLQDYAPVQMGIGINTGRAVVGCIGSPRRTEYTAIGATVNLASRVEALTKV